MNAVGGLLAGLAVAGIAGSSRALPVYIAGALLTGVALVLTGFSPNLLVLFVPMFLMGLGLGGFQTLNSVVIVLESDPAYYGRVISLNSLGFAGFMLAGYPVGLAAGAYGERVTLVVLGVMTVSIALVLWPVIARAKSSLTSENQEAEVETATAGGG